MKELILVSQSPRRRELIGLLGYPFRAVSTDVDESLVTDTDPLANVMGKARLKGVSIAEQLSERSDYSDVIIVAADTTVAVDGLMLGKPVDVEEAQRMLVLSRNRAHKVHTGVMLFELATGREVSGVNTAVVTMRNYSDAEIAAYIATGDPMDKAGAYAIQHPIFRPVAYLDGCFTGVMGLSVCHLIRLLSQLGLSLSADFTAVDHAHQGYPCALLNEIFGERP